MTENLRRLRDAVIHRGRAVEVTPEGEVRESPQQQTGKEEKPAEEKKATKLAPRTFGASRRAGTRRRAFEGDLRAVLKRIRPLALVRVFVPSVDHQGKAIDGAAVLAAVEGCLHRVAKGLTVFQADGSWKGGDGKAIREHVFVVEAYLRAGLSRQRQGALLSSMFGRLQRIARQKEWLVVVDGKPFFVAK